MAGNACAIFLRMEPFEGPTTNQKTQRQTGTIAVMIIKPNGRCEHLTANWDWTAFFAPIDVLAVYSIT